MAPSAVVAPSAAVAPSAVVEPGAVVLAGAEVGPGCVVGANSVYALVVHCCGVMERWGGESIAGRSIHRDRAAEFTATGTIGQLEEIVAAQRRRWVTDLADYEAGAPPRGPDGWEEGDPEPITQGFIALHVIEELFQHLGHVDLTVDLVLGR